MPTEPESAFGIIVADAAGDPRFIQTSEVPNAAEQTYGWFVWVGESSVPVRWIERLTLPRAPESWAGATSEPNISVSPDGRTAITQGEGLPDDGFIFNVWSVAPGDPAGEYEIVVMLPNDRTERFLFTLSQPRVLSGEAEESSAADPVAYCEAIHAEQSLPIGCAVDEINDEMSMLFSFPNLEEFEAYWEELAAEVGVPFCQSATGAREEAAVYVVLDQTRGRRFDCARDEWGDWFEIEADENESASF